VKQHKLRKQIAVLSQQKSNNREFISLYVPGGFSVEQILATLKKESTLTSQNKEDGNCLENTLRRVIQHLKEQKAFSESGLALFAGVFRGEIEEVFRIDELIPPEDIVAYCYVVDDHFHLEPLREMLRDPKIVGVLALDSKQASFGIVVGDKFEKTETITSGVAGKTGKGGSSQRRYERERESTVTAFFHRVAEHVTKTFLENKVNVLIAGGPGQTKNDFLKGDFLHYELSNMMLNVVDTQGAGKEALREIFEKSSGTLKTMCGPEEKKIVERLMASISKQDGLATYGFDAVMAALKKGEVQTALVDDNTDLMEKIVVCKKCGNTQTRVINVKTQSVDDITKFPCERCGAISYDVDDRDIVDVLEDMASHTDAGVEVISSESQEKAKLASLGGLAALLRYKQVRSQ
jgi:peptide chain release factor subunit 1